MKGIILAGGSGSRLWPITKSVSKQLLPVFDKPLIYYPLTTLMLGGIQEIAIVTDNASINLFEKLLGDGSEFGVKISYFIQVKPEGIAQAIHICKDFILSEKVALILGDNFFYGDGFESKLNIVPSMNGATIFAVQVSNPSDFGVVEFNERDEVTSIIEKPIKPLSNWVVPGLYLYDETVVDRSLKLQKSDRGEFEITDLNRKYLMDNQLTVVRMTSNTNWFDMGTPSALLNASGFVEAIQSRHGVLVGSPHEAAVKNKWVSLESMSTLVDEYPNNTYTTLLRRKLKENFF